MSPAYDAEALGSDLPRSRSQFWSRRLAEALVGLLGLDRTGLFATELQQAIRPIATIPTRHGDFHCRAGHGRLVWRARSFHEEEPETVAWLDTLSAEDVYWDVGANVGLYALYAAKFRAARVIAIEPEAQNYALLVENIALNGLGDRCLPIAAALGDREEFGRLLVRYVTLGGAFNLFRRAQEGELPESFEAAQAYERRPGLEQGLFSTTIDALVHEHGLPPPTYLKIDVDGLEPRIIDGASRSLADDHLKSVLIELNTKAQADMAVPRILARRGFRLVSERSNWLSRAQSARADELPATNMLFRRD